MSEPERETVSAAMIAAAELIRALASLAAQDNVTADQLRSHLEPGLEHLRSVLPETFFDQELTDSTEVTDHPRRRVARGAGIAIIRVTATARASWNVKEPEEEPPTSSSGEELATSSQEEQAITLDDVYDAVMIARLEASRMPAGASAKGIADSLVGWLSLLLWFLSQYGVITPPS